MIHNLTYSLIAHLNEQLPELTDVVWIYDGINLTRKSKPFATVEQMPSNTTVVSKEREYYETVYRFQVGLYAKSISERSQFQERIRDALLKPNINLLDTSKPSPPPAIGFFYCDVLSEVPVPIDSATSETNKHRVYFDVEVTVQRRNDGGIEFTQ